MSQTESISVLVPVYNAGKYLAEAIESVLNQKGAKPLEIIILDDGSTDASTEVAESYKPKVSLYQQAHSGISAARNATLQKAKGDFIAFLDADDVWTEDHLEKLLNVFKEHDKLDVAAGHVEQFLSEDVEDPSAKIPDGMKVLPGFVVGAMLIKKSVFDVVGTFNEELTLADTVDWFARFKDSGLVLKMIDDIVLKRRIHSTNSGIRHKDNRKDYTKVLMASIKRKREKEQNK